ncbi:MAG: hypothetical protein R3F36_02420 [Candidatus Competibacteraceae bacterium]
MVQKLRATHARADAAALYKHLFGKLDEKLKGYDSLYIAPDGVLSLLAFSFSRTDHARRPILASTAKTLRQVATGRHLRSPSATTAIWTNSKELLAFGRVNYRAEGFGAAEQTPQKPQPTDQNLTVALRTVSGKSRPIQETRRNRQ